ncbi:MAG: hypothetical protein GC157_03185 [Frankiales bacterium]|nr:hypothetical protein [Frankiales bacterium]
MTADPGQLREAMAGFVSALHGAYLDQARHLPVGERGSLPLLQVDRVTVLAVGVRHLHVLATTAPLAPPAGPEVAVPGSLPGLEWTLRFFDPIVVPALGAVDESDGPQPAAVREVLGVPDVVYHLSVSPGAGLSAHHAQHAGTALANQHAAAFHDHDTIRARSGGGSRGEIADEYAVADRLGLHRAARLLALQLAPRDERLSAVCADSEADDDAVRAALVAALRAPSEVPHPAGR